MQFFDKVTPRRVRRTEDGYLVADAPVARTGVQLYRGAELGRPDKQFVRVLRSEDEVFDEASMHSYAFRPMTNDHPGELVTADNWKEVSIGNTGGEVTRDGQTVRVPLVMMDARAIEDFEGGKRELSMGYTADVDFFDEEQETEDGLKYDAVQKNLRMNHVALVSKGRAGVARIGGGSNPNEHAPDNEGGQSMAANLRKVMVDGLSVETTDQGAEAIEKLQGQLADAQAETKTQAEVHANALAAKDKDLADRDAKIKDLEGKALSDEDLDKLITARGDLLDTAKRVHDGDYTGLSTADIKRTAVVGVLGEDAVADKSEAYIDAAFDLQVKALDNKSPVNDGVRKALADKRDEGVVNDADKAHADYENNLTNAWKNPGATAQ